MAVVRVIDELIHMEKNVRADHARGEELGLTDDELAFYDPKETDDNTAVRRKSRSKRRRRCWKRPLRPSRNGRDMRGASKRQPGADGAARRGVC